MSPAEIVQAQLDTYNAQDLDAFCALFAEDCVIADLNGAVTQRGQSDLRARYGAMFAQYPQNQAEIIHRMVMGDVVIDHERVHRSADLSFEAIAIYTIKNGRIARCDFVRS
ncbi:MAG: SgcJ/EcaC family oxidoreductase [Hyphomonadaceae bacterium]